MNQGRPAHAKRPELGERIAQARQQAGLTQKQLAERVGTSQPAIARLETGG
ncbi:MAG: helix-turn-helix transcriptional regulator [Spirochaetaceae bacterium]|nr:helix-turn-helix transcriptional regulator [Spirochaetaceae bacterium]